MDTTQIERAVSILLTNAELVRDPRMEHATDCYAVPVDDIEALRKASVAALAVPDVGGLTDERIKALAEQSLSYVFTSECAEVIDFARAIEREVLVAIGKPFLAAGGYWIKPHATKAAAEKPAGLDDRLDGLREAVSDFRKATYEFARGQDPEDHKRMMESQMRIFAEARALANAQPPEAAPAAPEQAVPEAVREFLQGLVDCKGGMVSGNQLSRRAEELLAGVPEVPAPTNNAKGHAVQQAQQWAQEARTQRATVLSILRYFGLPEHDWEALRLIAEKVPAPQPIPSVPRVAGDGEVQTWPERIWLQHQFEYVPAFEVATKACSEITWCQNNVDRYDIEYVRSDLAHVARQDQAGPAVAPQAELAAVPEGFVLMPKKLTQKMAGILEFGRTQPTQNTYLNLIHAAPSSTEAAAQAAPAEQRDAARWQFMMRVADNDKGPEAQAMERLGNEQMEEGRPESEQMNDLVDAAIRALRSTSTDGEKGGA